MVWPRLVCSSGEPKRKMPTSSKRSCCCGPSIAYVSPIRRPLSPAVVTSVANVPAVVGSSPSMMKNCSGAKLKPIAGGPWGRIASPSPSMMTTSLNEITPGIVRATPSTPATTASTDSGTVGRSNSSPISSGERTASSAPDAMSSARPLKLARSESVNTNTPTTIATLTTTAMVVSANRIFLSSRFLIVRRNIDQSPRLFIMSSTPSGVGSRNSSTILPSTRKMTRLAYDAATGSWVTITMV